MKPHFDAERNADGSYVVRPPKRMREPVDWPAVAFVAVFGYGTLSTFVGAARGIMRW